MVTQHHIIKQLVDERITTLRQEAAARAALSSDAPQGTTRRARRRRWSARARILGVRGVAR